MNITDNQTISAWIDVLHLKEVVDVTGSAHVRYRSSSAPQEVRVRKPVPCSWS